jgi:hypothetical protein
MAEAFEGDGRASGGRRRAALFVAGNAGGRKGGAEKQLGGDAAGRRAV